LLKISSIFKDKLNNEIEYLSQLRLGIELLQKSLRILVNNQTPEPNEHDKSQLGEICHLHQNLALLYEKLENWEKMLFHARQALQIATKIPDYMVVVNSLQNISRSVNYIYGKSKSLNVILEGIDYFSKEAENLEGKNNLLALAQIYQIIKNLYDQIHDINKFEDYARKEAGVYIMLANRGIKKHIKNEQISSYYRGAALCYQSLSGNIIDAASCFFLAAQYAQKAKKFYDAAISYEDAAKKLELLHKYEKAWDLYQLASSSALRAGDYEVAILNLFNAESAGLKIEEDIQSLYHKLHKYLQQYAQIQHAKLNFFISGTLYLEAAENLHKLPNPSLEEIRLLLHFCFHEYILLFQETDIKKYPLSTIYYVGVLIGILNPIVQSFPKEILRKSNKSEVFSSRHYFNIFPTPESILDYIRKNAPQKYIDLFINMIRFLKTHQPLRKSFFVKNHLLFSEHGITEIKKIHDLILVKPELFPQM